MKTLAAFVWRYVLGALFTLTPVTAVLVVGWTQRASARAVARRWHAHAGNAPRDFPDFARAEPGTGPLAHWPRWIMADDAGALVSQARRSAPLKASALLVQALFGSLWLNAASGVRALIPLAIVAAPAWLLLLFSWWGGWENSFNKGYEQSWVGPTVALAGIAYFVLVMTLLPLAEARHALNKSWASFFDIGFLRRAAREVRLGLIGLTALFATAGFVLAALKIAPLGIGNAIATAADAETFARQYPLLVAAILFPLYLLVRLAAARVYAAAAVRLAAKAGVDTFASRERELLTRLSLDGTEERRRLGNLTRLVVGSGTLLGGTLANAAIVALWLTFVGQIYVSQFLVHDWYFWVNHPLVQLPWTDSIFSQR